MAHPVLYLVINFEIVFSLLLVQIVLRTMCHACLFTHIQRYFDKKFVTQKPRLVG